MLVTELIIFAGVFFVGVLGYQVGRLRGVDDGYYAGYRDGKDWGTQKLVEQAAAQRQNTTLPPRGHAFWCYAGDHSGPCPSHGRAL